MTTAIRSLTVVLIVSLLAGPLAPAAWAQQPATPPAPPPGSMQPVPAQPGQPDLFQETLKAQRSTERFDGMYNAGAIVVNSFLIPGRAITCVLGSALGVFVLAATLGSGYKAAAGAANEGCGGKWVVTGEDLRPDPVGARPFDWERN
jgi:hypothetical protein